MKVDAHQHFWIYEATRDSWITPEMSAIQRDFLPEDLLNEMEQAGIGGSIAVQTRQSEEENTFLLSLAAQHAFIKGIVGWIDLQAADVEDRLIFYSKEKKMKGFRHVLQGDAHRALMLRPAFMNGISKLAQFDFTYDILIYPDQLQYVPKLVQQFPEQKFVLDHLAKPYIKKREIAQWKKDITAVAQYKNTWCKVSGMITEAEWNHWQARDLRPYLDVVWEAFGAKRLMYGSDYPVCLVAGSYLQWVDVLKKYTSGLSSHEQALFWGRSAIGFYNL